MSGATTAHCRSVNLLPYPLTGPSIPSGRRLSASTSRPSSHLNSGGVKGVASHVIEPDGNGSKVTLTVGLSGIVATVFGPMIAGPSRQNVEMEAEELKRRSEGTDEAVNG